MAGYKYGGTDKSMTPDEVEEHLRAARTKAAANANGATPSQAMATSREARAAMPAPALIQGHVEPAPPPATLKGAVKVDAFPVRSPYPFREIAADGGVWKLDPVAFVWRGKPSQPQSIRAAASKYATEHGLKAKTVVEDGMVYIQFKAGGK